MLINNKFWTKKQLTVLRNLDSLSSFNVRITKPATDGLNVRTEVKISSEKNTQVVTAFDFINRWTTDSVYIIESHMHPVKDIYLHSIVLSWRPRVLNHVPRESSSFWTMKLSKDLWNSVRRSLCPVVVVYIW